MKSQSKNAVYFRIFCKVFLIFWIVSQCLLNCVYTEKMAFEAEVSKVMDVIINSLYKNKDVFLRELISNSSDALDKLRILALTDKTLVPQDHEYKIQIRVDKERRQLIIRDNGIGMTRDELISNLGKIAKSGTGEFIETLKKSSGDSSNLIGQFGVGFYSAFLVADRVTVISRPPNGQKHIWTSQISDGDYDIRVATADDDVEEPVDIGTKIILHLKSDIDDENNYLMESDLKNLIGHHSGFIDFPIHMFEVKEVEEPINDGEEKEGNEEQKDEEKKDGEDGDLKVEDDDQKVEPTKPKTRLVKVGQYTLVNEFKPLWVRPPDEVTEEEYNSFYKSFLAKSSDNPIGKIHFKVEGIHSEFKALIYIPARPSFQAFSKDEPKEFLRLYMKRVLITNEFRDIFPKYLSFIKGIIDIDSIPLNVSRETLQKTKALKEVTTKIVSKIFTYLKEIAQNDNERYEKFYLVYSSHLKMGIMTDHNRSVQLDILSLLRFHSSATDQLTSLDKYIERMKEGQTEIYYVSGDKLNDIKNLPYVGPVVKRGYEVIYMSEMYDEHTIQSIPEYKEKKFRNLAKHGSTFPDDTEEKKALIDEQRVKLKPLMDYFGKLLSKVVEKVEISSILDDAPLAVVSSQIGLSPSMEKLMKSAATQDPLYKYMISQKKILEINPNHPIIDHLLKKIESGNTSPDPDLDNDIRVLYQTAYIRSGYEIKDPKAFAKRIEEVMRNKHGMEAKWLEAIPEEEEENNPFDILTNRNHNGEDENLPSDDDAPLDPTVVTDRKQEPSAESNSEAKQTDGQENDFVEKENLENEEGTKLDL